MTQKKPDETNRQQCEHDSLDRVSELMPGAWGDIFRKFKGEQNALAIRSFPHHKNGFLLLASANYWAHANRYNELDEDYLDSVELYLDEIKWLHEQLGNHLKNVELAATGINYKSGDRIKLKAGAHFPGLEGKICVADGNFYADAIKAEWEPGKWCFVPAALFEKVD